ncbi:MAG: IPT/TIG domain-containing protein [Actinomycetes bacterium]
MPGPVDPLASCVSNPALPGCDTASSNSLEFNSEVAVSPDGRNVYSTASTSNAITTFNRSTSTGAVTFSACISNAALAGCTTSPAASLWRASGVAVSGDGGSVYVASFYSNTVTTFTRNTATGALTFSGCLSSSGVAGCTAPNIASLQNAQQVAVSPDSKQVYVTSSLAGGGAVTTFAQNTSTGALTFDSCIVSTGLAGCTTAPHSSLGGAQSVAASADGKNVYVSSFFSMFSALTTFTRNQATGTLTFAACITSDTVAGCATSPNASLGRSQGIEVSPDGNNVYSAAAGGTGGSNAVNTFTRNPTTGALAYSACISNAALTGCTTSPAASLGGADGLVISPDGRNVYTANYDSNSVTTFNRAVAAPTVNSVSPAHGPTTGGNTITITGTGFQPGATVTVGGKPCTNVVVVSSTEITCTAPAGPLGMASLSVTNPDGHGTTVPNVYDYVAAKLAQKPLNGCVTAPTSIPRKGMRKLTRAHCITNANRNVKVAVRCRPITRGDLAYCRVLRQANGRTVLRTNGYHLRITVIWSAKATATYSAYRYVRAYRT